MASVRLLATINRKGTGMNQEPQDREMIVQLGYKFGGDTHIIGAKLGDIETLEDLEQAFNLAKQDVIEAWLMCVQYVKDGYIVHRGGRTEKVKDQ